MNTRGKTVFLDEEIDAKFLAIIRDAEKEVVLVTPYLDLWGHARTAIELAVKKGIKVTVITRRDQELKKKGADAIAWLQNNSVDVMHVEGLHAKIYMNEHALLVSSMNMTESSTKNSLEVALLVSNEHEQQQLRDYVNNRVMGMAKSLRKMGMARSLSKGFREVIANLGAQQPGRQPEVAVSHPGTRGVCIRCKGSIVFDPSKPLCDECYESWAEYSNEDYQEHFCLRCGRPQKVTYAKPLCRSCYNSLR